MFNKSLLYRKINEEIELVVLEPFMAEDLLRLCSKNKQRLSPWITWPVSKETEEDFVAFIKKSLVDYSEGKRILYGIFYKGELIGTAGFANIRYDINKVLIEYWVDKDYEGRGIITKSCKELIDIAFNVIRVDKVEISVASNNDRSIAVCERLGFYKEGTITNHWRNIEGVVLDHSIYGIKIEDYLCV